MIIGVTAAIMLASASIFAATKMNGQKKTESCCCKDCSCSDCSCATSCGSCCGDSCSK